MPALFSNIKQHVPIAQLDEATDLVAKDSSIDTLISVGGGSPIGSTKSISFRQNEKTGKFLHHIAIPTTLSGAECTSIADYTKSDSVKTGIGHRCLPLGHPVRCFLRPPTRPRTCGSPRRSGLWAPPSSSSTTRVPPPPERDRGAVQTISNLFIYLPKSKASHPNDAETITRLYLAPSPPWASSART